MGDWFEELASDSALSAEAAEQLHIRGFVVISGAVAAGKIAQLAAAYDAAVSAADPGDVHVGSTTTRVSDLVNWGADFDGIYVHRPTLDACYRVLGRPFRLSAIHARTLHPNARPQGLHVDTHARRMDESASTFDTRRLHPARR
jgi:hypothetical protein